MDVKTIGIIKKIEILNTDTIQITHTQGVLRLSMYQLCHEARYFHTDDNLSSVIGSKLTKIEVLDSNTTYNQKKLSHSNTRDFLTTTFLHLHTTKGVVVINAYNEHNGHYDEFQLVYNQFLIQKKVRNCL